MNLLKKIFIYPIKLYQRFISPLKKTSSCRFRPTCSNYAIKAIKKYGVIKGSFLAIKRLLKCNPFNSGGYDPLD